jgi:hypothetical protein
MIGSVALEVSCCGGGGAYRCDRPPIGSVGFVQVDLKILGKAAKTIVGGVGGGLGRDLLNSFRRLCLVPRGIDYCLLSTSSKTAQTVIAHMAACSDHAPQASQRWPVQKALSRAI